MSVKDDAPYIDLFDVLSGYLLPGELMSGSAGMGFTPHIINIASGEVCDKFLWIWVILSVLVVYVIIIVGRVDELYHDYMITFWYIMCDNQ